MYYRLINELTKRRLGGLHSAPIAMVSVDFHEVERLQRAGGWGAAGALLAEKAERVEAAGADLLVLCTNTMHKIAPAIEAAVRIPLLHIADAAAARVREAGVTAVGLLGTRFTMQQDFYRGRLEAQGLKVLVPDDRECESVHRVIYDELCLGRVREPSRTAYLRIIERLRVAGAQGIIAGCTEIGMLIRPGDLDLPLYDTTAIHAEAAVAAALCPR